MASKSDIEWTDASWTPIRARNRKTGKIGWYCEHATTGCINCYSEGMNKRLGTGLPFKPGHRDDVEIFLDDKMLLAPLRWQKPRMIFVCSMTDLFADFVPDEWIDKMFAVMALCPQHTFQVLTKRAERMEAYFNGPYPNGDGVCARIADTTWTFAPNRKQLPEPPIFVEVPIGPRLDTGEPEFGWRRMMPPKMWPLANLWLGVSCERQEEADERIPHLLQTPAAVRFVSAEPLLGLIDLIGTLARYQDTPGRRCAVPLGRQLIDWIIVGGESGHGARPMHPDWARSIRDQCAAAGIRFFFKQWGEWAPVRGTDALTGKAGRSRAIDAGGQVPPGDPSTDEGCRQILRSVLDHKHQFMAALGKKAAGRLLDGREHNDMPKASA